jgi:hypothetical protein
VPAAGSGKLVVRPVGLLGVGLFALTMMGSGRRGKRSEGLTVPKSLVRIARRKPQQQSLQQQGAVPAPIPRALDPSVPASVPLPQASLTPAAEPVTHSHTVNGAEPQVSNVGNHTAGAGPQEMHHHQGVLHVKQASVPHAPADSSHSLTHSPGRCVSKVGQQQQQQQRGGPVPGCYYSEGEEDEEEEEGGARH